MTELNKELAKKANNVGVSPVTNPQAELTPAARARALVRRYEKAIATILPKHITAERITNVLLFAINQNPELATCEPNSFIASIVSMSQLGLELGPLGHAYLVPFNKSVKNANGTWGKVKLCQFIIGYKGMLDLMRRSGTIASINADVIRAGDDYNYESGLEIKLTHRPALTGRGEILAYYVAVKLKDGTPIIGFWNQEDVDRHIEMIKNMPGKTSEKDGMWANFRTEFAHKSIIRTMFKWMPASTEDQRLMAQDEKVLTISENMQGVSEIQIDENRYEEIIEAKTTGEVFVSPVDVLKDLMPQAFDTLKDADEWAMANYKRSYLELSAIGKFEPVISAISKLIELRNAVPSTPNMTENPFEE